MTPLRIATLMTRTPLFRLYRRLMATNTTPLDPIQSKEPKQPKQPQDEEAKENKESKKPSNSRLTSYYDSPVTWKSVAIGGSIVAIMLGYLHLLKRERDRKKQIQNNLTLGAADIRCSFDLIDTEGKRRTHEEFLGRWLLVYFGFTHCPDVCPEELEKLSEVIERLFKSNVDIVPLFITVDPHRDKPELIKKYLAEFSDKFIGLSGDDEQTGKTAKSFRVYYSPGPKDADDDYIVDHTIISYLIGPKGQLIEYFGQTKSVDEIEALIRVHMKLYKD